MALYVLKKSYHQKFYLCDGFMKKCIVFGFCRYTKCLMISFPVNPHCFSDLYRVLQSFCKFCDLNVFCLQCLFAILCKQILWTNDNTHTVKSYDGELCARTKLWDIK